MIFGLMGALNAGNVSGILSPANAAPLDVILKTNSVKSSGNQCQNF